MDVIGRLIVTEATCQDSMAWARSMLPIVEDGTVLIARDLALARGRQGRSWVLADGQITHTIVLKPAIVYEEKIECALASLNMALSLGLLEPFRNIGAGLKWPNDLVVNGKKFGGMLFENLWHGNKLAGVILGYSININNSLIEHQDLVAIATSVYDQTNKKNDLVDLSRQLFASLSKRYAQWMALDCLSIFNDWRTSLTILGKSIQVHNCDGTLLTGIAQDVLPNGDLVLYGELADSTTIVQFAQVENVVLTI